DNDAVGMNAMMDNLENKSDTSSDETHSFDDTSSDGPSSDETYYDDSKKKPKSTHTKGPTKELLKWYEDKIDEEIAKSEVVAKSKGSTSKPNKVTAPKVVTQKVQIKQFPSKILIPRKNCILGLAANVLKVSRHLSNGYPLWISPSLLAPLRKLIILGSCSLAMICLYMWFDVPAFDYIYNPSTNMFKRLSRPENSHDDSRFYRSVVLRMTFDPGKSLDYKVVQVGQIENRKLTLYKLNIEDHDHPIITIIEIPHELYRGRNFLESCGSCDDPMLILIDIPGILHLEGRLFESCRCLLLVCRDDIGSREFTIYGMIKGCSLWTVRKENSFLVMNLSIKVIKYNIISKTISEIFDIGSNQMDDDDDDEFIPPCTVDHNLYEFIPSLHVVRDKALSNVC
nr:hypothetical protein [Tanacetum cinerariifolium]